MVAFQDGWTLRKNIVEVPRKSPGSKFCGLNLSRSTEQRENLGMGPALSLQSQKASMKDSSSRVVSTRETASHRQKVSATFTNILVPSFFVVSQVTQLSSCSLLIQSTTCTVIACQVAMQQMPRQAPSRAKWSGQGNVG